jgi:hypothetical protein
MPRQIGRDLRPTLDQHRCGMREAATGDTIEEDRGWPVIPTEGA